MEKIGIKYLAMRNLILLISLIVNFSCSTEIRKYDIENDGNRMTLILKSDYKFNQIGSLWQENDKSEYFGTWRYIDEQNKIIETTIDGVVRGPIWTATPKDTFRIKDDKLMIE